MGSYIACGTCGNEVYTTGSRMPHHDTPNGQPCRVWHQADDAQEYTTGRDDDWWVYQGGKWESNRSLH